RNRICDAESGTSPEGESVYRADLSIIQQIKHKLPCFACHSIIGRVLNALPLRDAEPTRASPVLVAFFLGAEPERIVIIDRVAAGIAVQIQAPGEPDRVRLRGPTSPTPATQSAPMS